MARKAIVGFVGVLFGLAVLLGLGQGNSREQLQQLLLTQEELIETLADEAWVIKAVDRLTPEPEGTVATAVATYVNTNTNIALVIGLLEFQSVDFASRFVEAMLSAPQVLGEPRNLRAEAQENPELLPELLAQQTDLVFLLSLENDRQQLIFQRGTLLAFLRISREETALAALGEGELIHVAERQLRKIIDFCESLEGAKPEYCSPLAQP
jgi:hypothetical protein